ncbi:EF-hand [Cryphonectria parasitica EP155]|uniref:EF-hand n=1 Tax=Cryphonectria parasitica (strain ATCC 38755 / EP155) TaxID=660469 RepID=A0A9P4YB69_CRYP1|nr:EF-hand [Cryphonectria parasitica EP155]KAF3769825.1 EF-hand [Cryphonectria parasitica EP155]
MYGSPRGQQRPPLVSNASAASTMGHGNALSQLQPAQVRTLREGYQILDRDSDGSVNREDVADMLNQLGLPSTASDVSSFFPPSAPQTITLATFLNTIATSLASLSPSSELLSAFSAFDNDDSGQVDLAELRDALLHTAPEPGERTLTAAEIDQVMSGFSGKRAFGGKAKGAGAGGFGKRGEVFRYQEFVTSIAGGSNGNAPGEDGDEETEE